MNEGQPGPLADENLQGIGYLLDDKEITFFTIIQIFNIIPNKLKDYLVGSKPQYSSRHHLAFLNTELN